MIHSSRQPAASWRGTRRLAFQTLGDFYVVPGTHVLCTWSESKGVASRPPEALAENCHLRRHPREGRGPEDLEKTGFRPSPE
jgi:hypothetical protein